MKIFVIGDSISIQYGPYLEQLLAGKHQYRRKQGEAAALQNLDIAQGANGGDSSMVLAYLRYMQANSGIDADLLLLNCGLHDIKTNPATGGKQVELDLYRKNLEAIVAIVNSMSPRLVWMRTTPCDEKVHNTPGKDFYRFAADVEAYNAAADAIMAAANIAVIDLNSFTHKLGPELYCDHVHFHDSIRRQQAAYLAGWIDAQARG